MIQTKIYLLADTRRYNQAINVTRLQKLFQPLATRFDIQLCPIISPENQLALDGYSFKDESTFELLIRDHIKPNGGSCVAICFEPTKLEKNTLQQLNINYLSFRLHPIRFLSDLKWSVSSNVELQTHKWEVEKQEITDSVKSWKEKFSQFQNVQHRILMIAEQTPLDRSVECDGRFYNLMDFKDEIEILKKNYPVSIFLPHPNNQRERSLILANELGLETVDFGVNSYELMASGAIETVAALSSSLLYEAEEFDLNTIRFLRGGSGFTTPIDHGKLMYDYSFWEEFLQVKNTNSVAKVNPDPVRSKNFLRNNFEPWAYRELT